MVIGELKATRASASYIKPSTPCGFCNSSISLALGLVTPHDTLYLEIFRYSDICWSSNFIALSSMVYFESGLLLRPQGVVFCTCASWRDPAT